MYGTKNSNVAECPASYSPPTDINNYGDSLNRRLRNVDIQANPYGAQGPTQVKAMNKFLSRAHGSGNNGATIASAYVSVYDIKDKNIDSYSFALGAAEAVAGGTNFRTIFEQLITREINIDKYNRGAEYSRKAYLTDTNKNYVKDSCNREPEETEKSTESFCNVPERHFKFSNMSYSIAHYEKYGFNYGQNVNLSFHLNPFTISDNFWVEALIPQVGGGVYTKRVLGESNISSFRVLYADNQSTIPFTLHRMWAQNYYTDETGSALEMIIYCRTNDLSGLIGVGTPKPIDDEGPIVILPVEEYK